MLSFIEAIQVRLPADAIDTSASTDAQPAAHSSHKADHTQRKDKKQPGLKCPHCGDRHPLVRCKAFADLDIDVRNSVV